MENNNIYKYYKDLPAWAKGVVVVGGLVVGYLAATSVLKYFKEKNAKAKSEEEVNNASSELQEEIRTGVKPTLAKSSLEAMSNSIVSASNDCGTDDGLVVAQFDKLQNQADALAFVETFGLRTKTRCPFSDDPRDGFWNSQTPPMSLSAMIASELSSSQIDGINSKLSSKGIKYKF